MHDPTAPLAPARIVTYEHEGAELPLYWLEMNGKKEKMALLRTSRESSAFVNPVTNDTFEWQGKWRTLSPVWKAEFKVTNFIDAWNSINFLRLLFNTGRYVILGTFGMILSSSLVAYGFSRFNFPFKNFFFLVILATLILPPQVTMIPRYVFFKNLGLVGTWWPIILPHFFANAWNIFLLRQFFMGIPREMDDAAKIDGAGPIRIYFSIILPQAAPALVAAGLFHFFYCWNDFFDPLIYLVGHPEKFPVSIGLNAFQGMHWIDVPLVQAASLLALLVPLIVFIICQRVFMQGVVVTGVDK